jgi:hypothetical protein
MYRTHIKTQEMNIHAFRVEPAIPAVKRLQTYALG